jgi:hypothetical protein
MLYFSVYLDFKFFVKLFILFLVCLTVILKLILILRVTLTNLKISMVYRYIYQKKYEVFKITAPSIIYYCYLSVLVLLFGSFYFFIPLRKPPLLLSRLFSIHF